MPAVRPSVLFWFVDHAAWRQHRQDLAAVVSTPLTEPRRDASIYTAVTSAARDLGVLHGPGVLRIVDAAVAPPLERPGYLRDPRTPHLTVGLADGSRVTVQGADITSLDTDPGDQPTWVAQDVLYTVAMDLTRAVTAKDPEAARQYLAVVREPQSITVDHQALESSSLPHVPSGRLGAGTLQALLDYAQDAGVIRLPGTVESVAVRDSSKTNVGVNLTFTDQIKDVRTTSFLLDVKALSSTDGAQVLARFIEWFNAEAWHQHAVLPSAASARTVPFRHDLAAS